jgi:NADPH2:quinone reductase
MKALVKVVEGPGLEFTEVPDPQPGPGDVVVRVLRTGICGTDLHIDAWDDWAAKTIRTPLVLGHEFVGEVVEIGASVTGVKVGDLVSGEGHLVCGTCRNCKAGRRHLCANTRGLGVHSNGAFAEYAVLPAAGLAPVPAGWTDEQSLGLVLNWATALAALRLGRVSAGETVLVEAAAGAVGQAAVRMARHFGATVIGTASPGKHDVVRALGAAHVVDHPAADLTAEVLHRTAGRGADLVLESIGGDTFRAAVAATRRITGRLVVYGVAGGEAAVSNRDLNFAHPIQAIGLHIGVLGEAAPDLFAELMAELAALIAAGVYPPGRPAVHDLADGPKVLAELEAGATIGKLALRP